MVCVWGVVQDSDDEVARKDCAAAVLALSLVWKGARPLCTEEASTGNCISLSPQAEDAIPRTLQGTYGSLADLYLGIANSGGDLARSDDSNVAHYPLSAG